MTREKKDYEIKLFYSCDVVILKSAGISFSDLLELKSEIREELIKNSVSVIILSRLIRVQDLLALDPEVRAELIKNAIRLVELSKGYEGRISALQLYSVLIQNLTKCEASKKIREICIQNHNTDVKKNAGVLAQAFRTESGFFGSSGRQLSPENLIKIASQLGENTEIIEDDREADKLAYDNFQVFI